MANIQEDTDGMFDDDMDDDLLFGIPEENHVPNKADQAPGHKDKAKDEDDIDGDQDDQTDDDDENEFSISKIKAEVGFIDDEFVGVSKTSKRKKPLTHDDDTRSSIVSLDDEPIPIDDRTLARRAEDLFTEPQKPFQPTSSPATLPHRYMVWNNIGIIRSYTTDDDTGIDVAFHDHNHHQSIHLQNNVGYTTGAMSAEAIIFACPQKKEQPSKLFCLNYGAWDSSKQWTIDMQFGEEILAIAIGRNWIAAATNLNRLRLFSISGVQKFVYEIPGQVVAIAGFNSILFLTYHFGVGMNNCQSIYYCLFKMNSRTLTPLIQHLPIPLTPRSTLSWIGFSEEGTPSSFDSSDCLRILNGQLWTPVCNMREFLSAPSDHFWIISFGQLSQTIRAIKCKGARYPPTLPIPTEIMLEAKIPLCEMDTDKGQLEDLMLRSQMMCSILKKMEAQGIDTDTTEYQDYQEKANKNLIASTTRLYSSSVEANKDFRGSEYFAMMSTLKMMEVAIKFANAQRKPGLAERLRKIAKDKMEANSNDDDEEYEDFEKAAVQRTAFVTNTMRHNVSVNGHSSALNSSISDDRSFLQDSFSEIRTESQVLISEENNPLLKKQKDEIRNICSTSARKSNPFKKVEPEVSKKDSQELESENGFGFIQAWKKPADKSAESEFNPKHSRVKGGNRKVKASDKVNGKESSGKGTKKKQATLFDMNSTRKEVGTFKPGTSSNSNPQSPATINGEDDDSTMANSESFADSPQQDSEPAYDSRRSSTKRKRNDYNETEEVDLSLPFSSLTSSSSEKKSKSDDDGADFSCIGFLPNSDLDSD